MEDARPALSQLMLLRATDTSQRTPSIRVPLGDKVRDRQEAGHVLESCHAVWPFTQANNSSDLHSGHSLVDTIPFSTASQGTEPWTDGEAQQRQSKIIRCQGSCFQSL